MIIVDTSPVILPAVGIAAYHGRSFFPSRLIRWFTWSDYSHVSIFDLNGPVKRQVYQAWHRGGCQWSATFGSLHQPGTRVDIFAFKPGCFPSRDQQDRARRFLDTQEGKKYDVMGIVHCLFRYGRDNQTRWFCSEIANRWASELGAPLVMKPDYKVTPGECAASPILDKIGYSIVGENGEDGPLIPIRENKWLK